MIRFQSLSVEDREKITGTDEEKVVHPWPIT